MKKLVFFTCLVVFVATPAFAHKIKVSVFVNSGVIHIEGRYPDDRPVKSARIFVKDSRGQLLVKDQADEKGTFSFPIPKIETLEITVGDMLGHRTTVKLRQSVLEAGQD